MSEPFDPSILQTQADGLPMTSTEPPAGLTSMLSQQRHAFTGLDDLPIDEPDLPGQGLDTESTEDPAPPADAVPLDIDPGAVASPPAAPQSAGDLAALHAHVARLQAELDALRAPVPSPTPAPIATPPPTIGEDVYTRIGERFERAFAGMEEQRAEEDDRAFAQRRGRSFAETIVQAVYEDLLPHEAVQHRLQPAVERYARPVVQTAVSAARQQDQLASQQDSLIVTAVARAQAAGYDVYLPNDPKHLTSPESRMFWEEKAILVSRDIPGEQQIATVLALMPQKAAPAPTPTPTPTPVPARPQPMGRGGATPPPRTGGASADGEYQPMSMGGMLSHSTHTRRVGTA